MLGQVAERSLQLLCLANALWLGRLKPCWAQPCYGCMTADQPQKVKQKVITDEGAKLCCMFQASLACLIITHECAMASETGPHINMSCLHRPQGRQQLPQSVPDTAVLKVGFQVAWPGLFPVMSSPAMQRLTAWLYRHWSGAPASVPRRCWVWQPALLVKKDLCEFCCHIIPACSLYAWPKRFC